MCGIAGVLCFGAGGEPVGRAELAAMSEKLAHRGPDGEDAWLAPSGRVGLAHRRLAIIDCSPLASQPMADPQGRYRVILNGEIYNHAELREELRRAGRTTWNTDHSDTEVLVQAFAHWGIDCLERLRGMFAFALWDELRQELWLARDRFGIKPLYYALQPGRIAFASEIKALLTDRRVDRSVDETALFHYLSFLVSPAPQTLFAGVRKLPCATWMRISADGRTEQRAYWNVLERIRPASAAGEEELARELVEWLEDSVRAHKVSDVPVGVFLSGGVDSSANAVLFSRGEAQPVRTFSIGYAGDNPSYRNELEFARLVARQIGAEHHELLLTQADLEQVLPRMVYLQDEPIADPVCIPVYYVARLARENGVTVCHVGEGADELFAGYPYWQQISRLERWARLPGAQAAKGAAAAALGPLAAPLSFRYEWLRRSAAGRPIFWGGAEAFTQADKERLLSPRLRTSFAGRSSWEVVEPFWERFRASAVAQDPLNWMAYLDLNLRLPELLLMRVDKMSMGSALEARVPYLDHCFVERALGIDPSLRIRHGRLKHVFRKAVAGLLPREITERPKQGFGVPMLEWMRGRLQQEVCAALERFCARTDLLDAKAARGVALHGRPSQAWYLYNLALWWERYAPA
jgi:asparagine synthase (glutamine-hydrolysing)